MAPYLEHMRNKPAHERRLHAMRVAGVLTALVFAGWVTTLGLQAGSTDQTAVAGTDTSGQTAAAAAAPASGYPLQGNQLVVASSTQ